MSGALGISATTYYILDTTIVSVDPRTQKLFDESVAVNQPQIDRQTGLGGSRAESPMDHRDPSTMADDLDNLVNVLTSRSIVQQEIQAQESHSVTVNVDREFRQADILDDWDFESVTVDISESPVRDGQISYEDLIDLIHQSSIEKVIAPDPVSISSKIQPQKLDSITSAWHEIGSDPEVTYAFDLDQVFASSQQQEVDNLDSIESDNWDESVTYVVDLDGFEPSTGNLTLESFCANDLNFDQGTLVDVNNWDEGVTYAIDLEDFDPPSESVDLLHPVEISNRIDLTLIPHPSCDDEPDFDSGTQTSTEIYPRVKIEVPQTRDLTSICAKNKANTKLMNAVVTGDLDLVMEAVQAKANLDLYDWNLDYSLLGMAIDRGYVDIVRFLLGSGVNPHPGSSSITALGLAAERGEAEIVELLLARGVDVNEPVGRDNWTALFPAIENGHRSIVELLVTAGAKINIWSRGETPILFAAKCEEREIYNYLYRLVNSTIRLFADRDGEKLLETAYKRRIREQNRPIEKLIEMAMTGNEAEVNRAIELGIEINEIGAQGHNALMAAAYYGHGSVLNILLRHGANPNILSDGDRGLGDGMTALMLAASSFFASNRHLVVEQLIEYGADVNLQGAGGKTAIMYAASGSGYQDCVETLIKYGANLDLRDHLEQTALTLVAAVENYPIFNILLQAGASTVGLESIQLVHAATIGNVDRVKSLLSTKINLNFDRGAAICSAAAAGHTQIVELLIRAGANVNLTNRAGFTPLSSADHGGYGEIVKLLRHAGADV